MVVGTTTTTMVGLGTAAALGRLGTRPGVKGGFSL
jgi:hypothetical protein